MSSAGDRTVELTYTDGRGLAEIIRLTLTVSGIEYNEVNLKTREQYLALKPELLFGQTPLLRIDGMKVVQSGVVARYVARKGKLLGSNDLETVRIEMLYDGTRDFYSPLTLMVFVPEEKVKEDVQKLKIPKYAPAFDKLLGESSSGYLVGDSLSLADLGLFEVLLAIFDYFDENILREYTNLMTFYEKLKADDRIKRYIKNIRKPKNAEAYVAEVRAVLSHITIGET